MARGHRIGEVAELPCVVSNDAESLQKTKAAVEMLKKLGCEEEMQRVLDSRKVRKGKGKYRNRRYVMRRGPLVIYSEDGGIKKAMRNIPGVETASVERLNLLTLAPGGNFGRFVIWTEGAFKKLSEIYGTLKCEAPMKKGYSMPRAAMENADVARIINSDEVQSVLKPKLDAPKKFGAKFNPLKNKAVMEKLNPGATQKKAMRKRACESKSKEAELVQKQKKARLTATKAYNAKDKKGDQTFFKKMMKAYEAKAVENADEAADEE
jgi:large subunit ribosomal protein L4e